MQIVKDVFGDFCLYYEKEFVDYVSEKPITLVRRTNGEDDYFLQGKDYLIEIAILSTCTSFISARGYGTIGTMMLADDFENTYFFDLGVRGVFKKFNRP